MTERVDLAEGTAAKLTPYVIQIEKPWHVAWWAEYFGVSEEVILDAVRKVGDRADEVADFLRRPDEHHLKHQ